MWLSLGTSVDGTTARPGARYSMRSPEARGGRGSDDAAVGEWRPARCRVHDRHFEVGECAWRRQLGRAISGLVLLAEDPPELVHRRLHELVVDV